MAEIPASEILISTLPTKEVTLAPNQVTIVREIHTTIQLGQNELTIFGLDARVNRDSIRIEGSGPATVTDIQTSIVPQRAQFDDIYPQSSDSSSDENEISEDEGLNDPEVRELRKEIGKVEGKLALAKGKVNSSIAILGIMNDYGKGMQNDETKDVKKFQEFLDVYSARRDAEGVRNHKGVTEVTNCEKELAGLKKRVERRTFVYLKEQRKASKAVRVQKEKQAKARKQKRQQQDCKRREQRHFWGTNVGQVVVTLDSYATFTPGSSRRSSVAAKVEDIQPVDVVLRLSYIIPGPSWVSRYDLQINSPSSSARLTYRAEFRNSSTETWCDSRVTLSTSQASFSGIGTRIPSLDAWNIKLATGDSKPGGPSWDRILGAPKDPFFPPQPRFRKGGLFAAPGKVPVGEKPQAGGLFGQAPSSNNNAGPTQGSSLFGNSAPNNAPSFGNATGQTSTSAFGAANNPPTQGSSLFGGGSGFGANRNQACGGLFGRSNNTGGGLFSNAQTTQQPPPASPASQFANNQHHRRDSDYESEAEEEDDNQDNEPSAAVELEDDDTHSIPSTLEHQDTVKQDYGMTTTYELPGRRTLSPSFVSRRHVLAELDLKNVTLTHVIVPKHREAAFLRARIKNTSALTLHPGQVGITVDGSFIGTASLETCGPNIFFNISLGIDPGIEVKYAKPILKPLSGAMFFNKEDGAKFRRSVWVRNTKAVGVDLVISDQVPVSDDENVRVRISQPAGLEKEGDEVDLDMEKLKLRGAGTVALLKNGEVKWKLRLEGREEVRLVLEYEAKVPSGSEVASG